MTTTTTTDQAAEQVAAVAHNLAAQVRNQHTTRKWHPTYGVTKRGMRTLLAQCEGACLAHAALTGQPTTMAVFAAEALGIDTRELAELIDNS